MKCFICEETIKKADLDDSVTSLQGKPAHWECKGSQEEYASTLFEFTPAGQVNKTLFDNDFIHLSEADNYEKLPIPIKEVKWINSGGYRGYTDWELLPHYIKIADGWVTGFPDETTERKIELSDIFEQLQDGHLIPPMTLYWVFGHTSNLFSTASDVIIHENDKKEFIKWLKTFNGDLEDFQGRFA